MQRFMGDDPTNREIASTTVDGMHLQLYSDVCKHPETHSGKNHLWAQITDVRDASAPILVNLLPVVDDVSVDGHYTDEQVEEASHRFIKSFTDARNAVADADNFVRGLYASPILNAVMNSMDAMSYEVGNVGGSQDDDTPDMFGNLDLNTILH